jgi:hypothetical protein
VALVSDSDGGSPGWIAYLAGRSQVLDGPFPQLRFVPALGGGRRRWARHFARDIRYESIARRVRQPVRTNPHGPSGVVVPGFIGLPLLHVPDAGFGKTLPRKSRINLRAPASRKCCKRSCVNFARPAGRAGRDWS